MSDMMTFPATVEEFMEQYKIVDSEKVYTNGADLIPIFRMMQWFEHVSATDTISRQAAIDAIISFFKLTDYNESAYAVRTVLGDLPPVTPKQRTGKWIKITNTLYKCNRCGAVQLKGNYCKDCEAKMEGVNNDT